MRDIMRGTPIRPQTHITGDVGQTAVALIFKEWGWTADIVRSDYGEDIDCNIFVDNRRTALHFRCQVKSSADATESVRQTASGDFCISIATSICKAWLLSYFPVLLIVYDGATRQAFWTDVTAQIRENLAALSQDTMTLHVSREKPLHEAKNEIFALVRNFYARLLRLSSTALECEVFPILMPGYRAISLRQDLDARRQAWLSQAIEAGSVQRHRDSLPAWATSIKTLEGPYLYGWKVKFSGDDLDGFTDVLCESLGNFPVSFDEGEWIAFVCSPIRFSAKDDVGTGGTFWNRELTDWWSYARIGTEITSDYDYAFAIPEGFLRQIGRRARSWEVFHHVDPQRDVSIQLFASAATTPAYRSQVSTYRQHVLGQFLPWTCPQNAISELQALLRPLQLVFREVPGAPQGSGSKSGVICTVFFEPRLGLFGIAGSWAEFTRGSVRTLLDEANVFAKLPGQEGPREITDIILGMLGDALADPPDQVLVTERHYIAGLPLDQANRVIIVERFRRANGLSIEKVEHVLTECKEQISSEFPELRSVDASWGIIEFPPYEIIQLSVSWVPPLEESSAYSFERLEPLILGAFDRILPCQETEDDLLSSTYGVLKFASELYFEGDCLY